MIMVLKRKTIDSFFQRIGNVVCDHEVSETPKQIDTESDSETYKAARWLA
jgi:hypothetical protein